MSARRIVIYSSFGVPFVILSAALLLSGSARRAGSEEVEMPGARDPSLPGSEGFKVQPVYAKNTIDVAVSPNVLVNNRDLCPNGRGNIQSETSIAVGANGVMVAAFNDSRGVCEPDDHAVIGWGFSLDYGQTWTDGGTLPNSRQLNNGDPWLGVSPDGTVFYLAGLYNFYSGFGFYRGMLNATADGIDWDLATVISFPGAQHDKEAIAVDPNTGTIYLSYTRIIGNQTSIYFTQSYDGGYTWTPQVPVFVATPPALCQGSSPAVDSAGNLYVTYLTGSFTSGAMRVSRSTDGGASFSQIASFPFLNPRVDFTDRSNDFPQIVVDATGGARNDWIYVVWQNGAAGNIRPMITHSEDGGETWATPVGVNQDAATAYRWYPSVAVDGNGNVNVVYLDRRNNPGTGFTDLYLSQSTDGATTFTDTQLTDVTGTWQGIARDPGFTYSGDYLRVVAQYGSVYAVFPDPRNGDPDVYFVRIDAAGIAARNNQR